MTGCGCLVIVTALVAFLAIFLRGSTDAGEPYEQIVALGVLAAAVGLQALRARAGTRSRPSAASIAAPTRRTVASS